MALTFDDLLPWDGGVVVGRDGTVHNIVFFLERAAQGSPAFAGMWNTDGTGRWSANGKKFTPDEAMAAGWVLAGTVADCMRVSYQRHDDATASSASDEVHREISKDIDGAAFRVALASGRISGLVQVQA